MIKGAFLTDFGKNRRKAYKNTVFSSFYYLFCPLV